MKPKTCKLTIVVAAILVAAVFVCSNHAWSTAGGHGGGGGDGGGADNMDDSNLATYAGSATTFVSDLSPEELQGLTQGLSEETRDTLLADMSTWPEGVTVNQLIAAIDSGTPVSHLTESDIEMLFAGLNENAQQHLSHDFTAWTEGMSVLDLKNTIKNWEEGDRVRANLHADVTDSATTMVEILDMVGEKTQTVLSYCPGVGWHAVGLDAVREAANARKEGKSNLEALGNATVKGSISVVTNYCSKADDFWDIAMDGTNVESVVPALTAYAINKQTENELGSAAQEAVQADEDDVTNIDIAITFFKDLVLGQSQKSKNRATSPSQSPAYGPMEGPAMHSAQ